MQSERICYHQRFPALARQKREISRQKGCAQPLISKMSAAVCACIQVLTGSQCRTIRTGEEVLPSYEYQTLTEFSQCAIHLEKFLNASTRYRDGIRSSVIRTSNPPVATSAVKSAQA